MSSYHFTLCVSPTQLRADWIDFAARPKHTGSSPDGGLSFGFDEDNPYQSPEQCTGLRDMRTVGTAIVEKLCADGSFDSHELSRILAAKYQNVYHVLFFEYICGWLGNGEYCDVTEANC